MIPLGQFRDTFIVAIDAEGIAIEHLHTPYGAISYRVRRNADGVTIHLDAERVPPGGIVLAWPRAPAKVVVKDGAAAWKDGELRFSQPQADVLLRE